MFHNPNYKDSKYYEEPEDYDLEELVFDSVVPAVCTYGCEVEPDGSCPHGMPSILIHLEMI
jgi:hypothetical protein